MLLPVRGALSRFLDSQITPLQFSPKIAKKCLKPRPFSPILGGTILAVLFA